MESEEKTDGISSKNREDHHHSGEVRKDNAIVNPTQIRFCWSVLYHIDIIVTRKFAFTLRPVAT